jgi:hypothetical protein
MKVIIKKINENTIKDFDIGGDENAYLGEIYNQLKSDDSILKRLQS